MFVKLDRRFISWTKEDTGDPEATYLLAARDALTWTDLLSKHRVAVLAEAGSGKSTELSEQAENLADAGDYVFSTTVQEVGRHGLSGATGVDADVLEAWRQSALPAYFFFDSVDEAKSTDIRFEDALKRIAQGIKGGEARAHIVLSGRHSDWEFRRDLHHLNKILAMPPENAATAAVDPNDLIVSVVRREAPPEPHPPAEQPLVVVMAALDPDQASAFARGQGVIDVDAFIDALDKSNLWSFARRPLDLGWLVDYWHDHQSFGQLADMVEISLRARLLEPDAHRARKDPIDADRAMAALQRIGAALVLSGQRDIIVPDSSIDLTEGRPGLDLSDILPYWTGHDRTMLVGRAAFDPASTGLVRLHNDNEGAIRAFLAAKWLARLMEENCPQAVVRDLLFATTHGVSLVIPSMRQTAAWLSLWNQEIARELIDRDPRLFMDAGDPGSLSPELRERVLKSVIGQIARDQVFDIGDRDSLRRFARPDLEPCLSPHSPDDLVIC